MGRGLCFVVDVRSFSSLTLTQFVVIESQLVLEVGLELDKDPSSEEARAVAGDVRHVLRQLQLDQVFGRSVEIAVFASHPR